MFDIGWSEILVVAVVAIIFIGPRDLIPMLRTFGNYAGKLKQMAREFQTQFNEALREVELDQVAKEVQDIRSGATLADIKKDVEDEMRPIGASMEDVVKPIKPPAEAEPAKAEAAEKDKPKPESSSAEKPAPKAKPARKARAKPAAEKTEKRAAGGGDAS